MHFPRFSAVILRTVSIPTVWIPTPAFSCCGVVSCGSVRVRGERR